MNCRRILLIKFGELIIFLKRKLNFDSIGLNSGQFFEGVPRSKNLGQLLIPQSRPKSLYLEIIEKTL